VLLIFLIVGHLMWFCSAHVPVAVSLMIGLPSATLFNAPVAKSYELLVFAVTRLAIYSSLDIMRRRRQANATVKDLTCFQHYTLSLRSQHSHHRIVSND
jgi:hypothetical protein